MRHDRYGFPRLEVIILVLCVIVNTYAVENLLPYVGMMVKQLMELESIDESGEVKPRGANLKRLEVKACNERMMASPRNV